MAIVPFLDQLPIEMNRRDGVVGAGKQEPIVQNGSIELVGSVVV